MNSEQFGSAVEKLLREDGRLKKISKILADHDLEYTFNFDCIEYYNRGVTPEQAVTEMLENAVQQIANKLSPVAYKDIH